MTLDDSESEKDDRVRFYRKRARGTPKFKGIASSFAMFLHSMPDQVGHDCHVIAGLTGNQLPLQKAYYIVYQSLKGYAVQIRKNFLVNK